MDTSEGSNDLSLKTRSMYHPKWPLQDGHTSAELMQFYFGRFLTVLEARSKAVLEKSYSLDSRVQDLSEYMDLVLALSELLPQVSFGMVCETFQQQSTKLFVRKEQQDLAMILLASPQDTLGKIVSAWAVFNIGYDILVQILDLHLNPMYYTAEYIRGQEVQFETHLNRIEQLCTEAGLICLPILSVEMIAGALLLYEYNYPSTGPWWFCSRLYLEEYFAELLNHIQSLHTFELKTPFSIEHIFNAYLTKFRS